MKLRNSKANIYLITCLASTKLLQAQFDPVESTGLPYHIIISQAIVDSMPITEGSIIGVFDDALCVGADTVEYDGQDNINIVAWEGSIISGDTLPGFSNGNPIEIRVYTIINNIEVMIDTDVTFEIGTGNFGFGSYSVISLDAFSGVMSDIVLSFDSLTFTPIQIGLMSSLEFSISNEGNIPLIIESIFSDTSLFQVQDFHLL